MIKGGTRFFRINKSRSIFCRLNAQQANQRMIEIQIRKSDLDLDGCQDCSQFTVVWEGSEVNYPTTIAHLFCKPGYYEVDIKATASGCGISQILIQLCLNEPDIHEVKHNGNQAMSLLQTDAMNMKWVTSHCKKIVYITNLDKPLNVASQYLKAAILSKFKFTFIF